MVRKAQSAQKYCSIVKKPLINAIYTKYCANTVARMDTRDIEFGYLRKTRRQKQQNNATYGIPTRPLLPA